MSKLARNGSVTHLWINQVNKLCARRGSTAWDCKWWWPWKYIWDNFKSPYILDSSGICWDCQKSTENLASISNILPLPLCNRAFSNDSNQNKITEWTGHWQHTSCVTASHHPQMGLSSYRKTSSIIPLILHYGELYNYFITYHNVIIIEIKCTINVKCLNHPEVTLHPILC